MRQSPTESNSDHMGRRRSQHRTLTICAALITAAIVAAAVLDQPDKSAQTSTDLAASSPAMLPSAPAQDGVASASTMSSRDATKSRFERSDEPATEDTVNAHGG